MLNRLSRLGKAQEGFTLIELLVVVAIIALLTAFAVPKLFDAINKAKGSQGGADVQTLSGALERYYMDSNQYPVGTTASAIQSALTNGTTHYMKQNTSFKNGFGKGYIYLSDSNGAFYILVDGANTPTSTNLTVSCGTTPHTQTVNTNTTGLSVYQPTGASAIVATDVAQGCSVTGGTDTSIVTN